MVNSTRAALAAGFAGWALLLFGCGFSKYYDEETLDAQKREILVDMALDARESQVDAKRELESALRTLEALEHEAPAPIRRLSQDLEGEVESARAARQALRRDIDSMQQAALVLFEDWEDQLDLYADEAHRDQLRQELVLTRKSYRYLIDTLARTEQDLDEVIPVLEDQVLMLKHEATLEEDLQPPQVGEVKEQVAEVLDVLNSSIERTEEFIEEGVGEA